MQSKIPVYPYNAKTAQERGEIEKWRESFRENCACAGGIDILIRENFDGMHLKKGTVEKIIELYGYKRVEHVLANTVQERRGDGRFCVHRAIIVREHKDLHVTVRKAHTAEPGPFAGFRGRLRPYCT